MVWELPVCSARAPDRIEVQMTGERGALSLGHMQHEGVGGCSLLSPPEGSQRGLGADDR